MYIIYKKIKGVLKPMQEEKYAISKKVAESELQKMLDYYDNDRCFWVNY